MACACEEPSCLPCKSIALHRPRRAASHPLSPAQLNAATRHGALCPPFPVPLQWQEKDCLPWAKQRLGELFQQLPLGDGVTTQLKSVEGDCVLNVRCGASA